MTVLERISGKPTPVRLTVSDYLLLDGSGAFDHYGKTELIDGRVYAVSPQHRPHGFVKDELAYRLRRALEAIGSPLHVATEQSVAMPPHSEPMPDIILTSEPRGEGAIPVEAVALLVEIAVSTTKFDLDAKAAVYAANGVSEYWVVDVKARVIHRMWSPGGDAYAQRPDPRRFGESIAAATIEGLEVRTEGF